MRRSGISALAHMLIPAVAGTLIVLYAGILPTALNAELAKNTFESRTLSHARLMHTHLEDDYLSDAQRLSVHQATYELAQESGGVSWSSGSLPSDTAIRDQLTSRIHDIFISSYLDLQFSKDVCTFESGQYTVDIAQQQVTRNSRDGLVAGFSVEQPPAVSCGVRKGNTSALIAPLAEVFSEGNRYFLLYSQMRENLDRIQSAWGGIADDTYTAQRSACGSPSPAESDARSGAEANALSAVETAFQDATGLPSGLSFVQSDAGIQVETVDVTSSPTGEDCNCQCVEVAQDGTCLQQECDTVYTATAEARPVAATVTLEIRDDEYTIPTADGAEHLTFLVENFAYSFQQ